MFFLFLNVVRFCGGCCREHRETKRTKMILVVKRISIYGIVRTQQ
nr:MAG TPA: hypothetical protein [Caudoviricetes sp.]